MGKIVEFLKVRWMFIVFVLLLTIIFIQSCEARKIKDDFEERDKQTELKIDTLEKDKKELFKQKEALQIQIDGLKVKSNNNKTKRDEKVTYINSFTPDEHFKFFSEWISKTNKQ